MYLESIRDLLLRKAVSDFLFEETKGNLEVFQEDFQLGALHLEIIGLSIELKDGDEVVASAVGEPGLQFERALFELIERITLISLSKTAKSGTQFHWVGTHESSGEKKVFSNSEIFPQSYQPEKWIYSVTSGASAHKNFQLAATSARNELIERDRVLRSWFGEVQPILLEHVSSQNLYPFTSEFEIRFYTFGEGVVGVFGFPILKDRPVLMGFGRSDDQDLAIQHAFREAIQRQVFLWEEPLRIECPQFRPHVDFHLDYYLQTNSCTRIKRWLDGHHDSIKSLVSVEEFHPIQESIWFVDLTPASLNSKIKILKAISTQRIPLTFGLGNPKLQFSQSLTELTGFDICVHPIA